MSFLVFSVDSLHSLVFLGAISNALLDALLSHWNSMCTVFFPLILKYMYTQRESFFLSYHPPFFWVYISFGSRSILECKVFQLGRDAQATRKKL